MNISVATQPPNHGPQPRTNKVHDPPARPVRCIIKLGGAAITQKAQLETLQADVLRCVCTGLAESAGGAHSGGAPPGVRVRRRPGAAERPRVRMGFALTRASVTRLNGHVVAELVRAGIPAVGLSPLGHYTTSSRQISVSGAAAVTECLQGGLVPVLHGDAVLDEQLGCTILSGDTLVRDLAEQLRPQYVVFLTNVAGVYDRPPEEEGARLLRRIVVRKDGSWQVAEAEGGGGGLDIRMTAEAHDVTGGIALKVEEAVRVARLGVPVIIARAGTPDGAAACRLGPQAAQPAATPAAPEAAAAVGVSPEVCPRPSDPCAVGWRGTLVVLEDEEVHLT